MEPTLITSNPGPVRARITHFPGPGSYDEVIIHKNEVIIREKIGNSRQKK